MGMPEPTKTRSSSSEKDEESDKDCPTREEVEAAKAAAAAKAGASPTELLEDTAAEAPAAPSSERKKDSEEDEEQKRRRELQKEEEIQKRRAARKEKRRAAKARDRDYEKKVKELKEREKAVRQREQQLRDRARSPSRSSTGRSCTDSRPRSSDPRLRRDKRAPSASQGSKPEVRLTAASAWCWCPRHGEHMCRKWVQSQWALVQHLRSKHGLSEEASKVEAEAAWVKKLEELQQMERSRSPRSPPDLRRPASPKGLPPQERALRSQSVEVLSPAPSCSTDGSSGHSQGGWAGSGAAVLHVSCGGPNLVEGAALSRRRVQEQAPEGARFL